MDGEGLMDHEIPALPEKLLVDKGCKERGTYFLQGLGMTHFACSHKECDPLANASNPN